MTPSSSDHSRGAPTHNDRELAGLTAVVTGSSSGIGRATALALASAGAAVVIHAAKSGNAAKAVSEEVAALGGASTVLLADLSQDSARAELVVRAWQWRGAVDIWVNNAGADVLTGDSGELFAATKGAVMAFTKSLARSLAPAVRVNCVAPGWIRTAWGEGASQSWQERARKESLLERWGTPEDVANAIRFLASPQASFITGHVLPVNGGFRHSG